MKKLSMKIEELRVESFALQAGKHAIRGTVRGNAGDSSFCLTPGCWLNTDPGCYETMGCTFTANDQCVDSLNVACQ